MGTSSSPSPLSKVVQVLVGFTLSLTLLFAAGRIIFEPRNQTRCEGMLNDGWWLGPNYTHWQPSGCMPHHFSSQEIASCLNHSRVLYIGDSIMREQFYSLTSFVRGIDKKGALHVDRKYDAPKLGLTFEFWWDPYINSTRTQALLNATDPDDRPSLLVMGSGTWYMRHLKEKYFDEWRKAVDRVFAAVEGSNRVADAVLFHPVQIPQFNLLNPVRRETITMDKIRIMNNYLKAKELITEPATPFAIPFSWNSIASSTVNVTQDGLHYLPGVTTVQANLALNFRCNDLLPKDFPMDHTCCYHYPSPAWYQNIFLLYFLIWIPIGFYILSRGSAGFMRRFFPAEISVLGSLFIFGLGVTYMYFCDRTQLFGKAQKFFNPVSFGALTVATLLGGLATLKSKKEGDLGLLNRAQTDEWKGWMQIIILVYHFLGASQIAGIYNAVRVLVAAYLFQTGYGHFFFFYKKGDFGIQRVLNVLIRLNLLTFVLQYVMNTNYLSYYFTPLVTFWFGVIWVTMYIGNKANKIVWFVVAKIVVMAILTGTYIHLPGLLEGTFDILEVLFNIHWDADEWRFRLALDAWIVYVGMLFALASIKFTEHKFHEHASWRIIKLTLVVVSIMAMWWYFWFELSQPDKATYNKYHPYISWIPILAFITLRNATVRLRNTSSRFYEFIGKCSLETFIGQFHMWLAADTKGLLIVLMNPSWTKSAFGWWFNLAVSSIIFVFICYYLNQTTGDITKWILSGSGNNNNHKSTRQGNDNAVRLPQQNENEQDVPLLPTSAVDNDKATGQAPDKQGLLQSQNEDEEWGETTTTRRSSRWNWLSRLWGDLRVKSVLFLLAVGLFNNLC